MVESAPYLSPCQIARSVEELRAWRLPDGPDVGLHRGVLKVLLATDALASLVLPIDLRAPRQEDAREVTHWGVVASLLAQADAVLRGAPHQQRIARLERVFPGDAAQLERMRRVAAERVRALRVRVDFVSRGPEEVTEAPPPPPSMRSSLLQ